MLARTGCQDALEACTGQAQPQYRETGRWLLHPATRRARSSASRHSGRDRHSTRPTGKRSEFTSCRFCSSAGRSWRDRGNTLIAPRYFVEEGPSPTRRVAPSPARGAPGAGTTETVIPAGGCRPYRRASPHRGRTRRRATPESCHIRCTCGARHDIASRALARPKTGSPQGTRAGDDGVPRLGRFTCAAVMSTAPRAGAGRRCR